MTNQVRRQSDENGFLQKIAAEEEEKENIVLEKQKRIQLACINGWAGPV